MKALFAVILLSTFCLSCNNTFRPSVDSSTPRVVEARGYVIPKNKLSPPIVIPAKEPVIVPAGRPRIFVPPNIRSLAGAPKVIRARPNKVNIPGKNGFSLPRVIPAVGRTVIAGAPDVVPARDAYTRDQNTQNFSTFGKLQGLSSDMVNCIAEDREGSLWIGTMRGGASKYDGKNFSHYSMKAGISILVRCILADSKGNIWFGTLFQGLQKYDGQTITNFTKKEGFSDSEVYTLIEDRRGNIWIGTNEGVDKFDGKNFIHYDTLQGMKSQGVGCILEDNNGSIWFGTANGVDKFDGIGFTHFEPVPGPASITKIYEDTHGKMWFGSNDGFSIYDGETFKHYSTNEGLSNRRVTGLAEDTSGNMWITTYYGGVTRFDGKYFTYLSETEGLHNMVTFVLRDKRNNMWVGTERQGMSKYNGSRITHLTMNEGLSDNWIRSILEDRSGNIWFGGEMDGVNVYDGKQFTVYDWRQGMMPNSVTASLQDRNGNIWFGHHDGICKFDGRNFYQFWQNMFVFSMAEDKKGNLWMGTWSGVYMYDGRKFTHISEKEGISNKLISAIEVDNQGNIWFATYGEGLVKYDGNNFTHFTMKEGLNEDYLWALDVDKNDCLWIGYLNNGLGKFDGRYFTHYDDKQGLAFNAVRSIMEDKRGNLWIGTYNGLSRMDSAYVSSTENKPGPYFKNYTHEDGLTGIEVNNGKTMHESKDGTIWIGTKDRLSILHPESDVPDTMSPKIQLTDLTLFNEHIDWTAFHQSDKNERSDGKTSDTTVVLENGVDVHDIRFSGLSKWYNVPQQLSLAHDNNNLTFHFVGITTNAPKKVRYQYKLDGFDQSWSAVTSRSEANYGNLPFGKYTFVVKAKNGDGYWSNEQRYSFVIRPPWWHTWWAYALYFVVLFTLAYGFFRYRLNKIRVQREMAEQKRKAIELEMQALRAQMNPHFIFNSLNSINLFILENNRLMASDYLSKFSRLIRLILHNSREAFIPLANELEALNLYMELEALRFNEKFKYQISIEEDININTIKVPPLIIQPYVENAIWHGLMHKKDNGNLNIDIFHKDDTLFCKISDNGVGRRRSLAEQKSNLVNRKSMGMSITAERIAILKQNASTDGYVTVNDIIHADGSAGGTEVILKIPGCYD